MRRYVLYAATLLLFAGAAALPLIAEEKHEHGMSDEVRLDKPLSEVRGRISSAIKEAGLVEVGMIDWSRFGREGMRESPGAPGTPRLEAGDPGMANNLITYICDSDECLKKISEYPQHALMIPARFVVYEKDGKACLLYCKPHTMISEHKVDLPEKARDHMKDMETRLEKVVEILKSGS